MFSREMETLEALLEPVAEGRAGALPGAGPPGVKLTRERLESYIDDLARRGRAVGTLETYRRTVYALFQALPADKVVRSGTLTQWQEELLKEGYSPRTVNARISAANGLMAFLERRDLQSVGTLDADGDQPELTRTEYLRLLTTARTLDKERLYLLVKLFGSVGLPLRELPRVTVEALAGEGSDAVRSGGNIQELRLPDFFRKELLAYAKREGIASGPLFRTKSGAPMGRTAVTDSIKRLCRDAQVPEEKGNPRCLKRLCQSTLDSIRSQAEQLVEQTYGRLMETEQRSIGWEADREVNGARG